MRERKRERETKENERNETKENKVATIYNNIKNMLLSDFTLLFLTICSNLHNCDSPDDKI